MAKKTFIPIPPMAELPPAEEINVSEILEKYLSGEIDLICVLGPTASGKTKYAVQLARQINQLVKATKAAGFDNLKGHKSVGGLRASIYNAMPREGVEALVEFLEKYEAEHL